MKTVGFWAGIIFIIIGILWGLITFVNSNAPKPQLNTLTPPPVSNEDITLGTKDKAKVTLIEYSDFECPACKSYASFIRQLEKDFGKEIFIVFRFFPLTNIHQNSMTSAQAAYAAHKQNKFWEMNDLLFQNQEDWANAANAEEIFKEYAQAIGLDIDQFNKDYNADATKEFINKQMEKGLSSGVNYTPTIYINDKKISNPGSYDGLKQLVQNSLSGK